MFATCDLMWKESGFNGNFSFSVEEKLTTLGIHESRKSCRAQVTSRNCAASLQPGDAHKTTSCDPSFNTRWSKHSCWMYQHIYTVFHWKWVFLYYLEPVKRGCHQSPYFSCNREIWWAHSITERRFLFGLLGVITNAGTYIKYKPKICSHVYNFPDTSKRKTLNLIRKALPYSLL